MYTSLSIWLSVLLLFIFLCLFSRLLLNFYKYFCSFLLTNLIRFSMHWNTHHNIALTRYWWRLDNIAVATHRKRRSRIYTRIERVVSFFFCLFGFSFERGTLKQNVFCMQYSIIIGIGRAEHVQQIYTARYSNDNDVLHQSQYQFFIH